MIVPAQAKPRQSLEIWPGQRALLVLPLSVGPNWNAGADLAQAITPVIRPELQNALKGTGKFSVTLPYRFDPIFRRAVADKRISEDEVSALVATPSLETANTVFSKLTFNQTPMVADVSLQELRIGGTQKAPTVQLQVSGKLYEVGGSGPFRSVVVTSRSFGGRTPQDRLQAAATDAFELLAAQFVAAPEEFKLPLPIAPVAPAATKPATGKAAAAKSATTKAGAPNTKVLTADDSTPGAMGAPASAPNAMSPTGGLIPQLPPAQPPLGIAVPQEPTLAK